MLAAVISEGGAAEDGLESESLPLPSGSQGPVRGRVWSQGATAAALNGPAVCVSHGKKWASDWILIISLLFIFPETRRR